jgi:hypothetical protein
MRRILSIVLALVVGLGPALASVPANALGLASGWTRKVDESQLPACCRRNGAHHCSMGTAGGIASQDNAATTLSAACSCPYWPHALASTAVQAAALRSASHALPVTIEYHSAHRPVIAAGIADRHSWPQRGPPASNTL